MGRAASIGAAWQESREALALGLPERKQLATLGVELTEGSSVAVEYARAEDYSTADGGSGEHGGTLTAQLAVAF